MTTNTMNCDDFHDRLMAYLEDETDAQTRAAVERHAVTCVDCGTVLADLRKLRIDAANLPDLTPSRDLWSGIAERIEAPVVSIGGRAPEARRFAARRAWQVGFIAASLAGATAIGYAAGRRPMTEGVTRVAQNTGVVTTPSLNPTMVVAAAPSTATPTTPVPAALPRSDSLATPAATGTYSAQFVVARLSADYDREIARLNRLIENRRNQMDPATVAIIERNLQIIDAAITDSKMAIARDPASQFLIESLNQSLQTKVELMRIAALLPSRT